MIIGTGIDIVEVERIQSSMERYQDHFLGRIFNPSEIDYCNAKGNPAIHFAARFAAKEAVAKALGTGFSGGIKWTDIEIVSPPDGGKPSVTLHSAAKRTFEMIGGDHIHLSMTHTVLYAVAQAVCEKL